MRTPEGDQHATWWLVPRGVACHATYESCASAASRARFSFASCARSASTPAPSRSNVDATMGHTRATSARWVRRFCPWRDSLAISPLWCIVAHSSSLSVVFGGALCGGRDLSPGAALRACTLSSGGVHSSCGVRLRQR